MKESSRSGIVAGGLMEVEIPDDLVKRATKAANWQFGKDSPQTQIIDIITDFCEKTEVQRGIEEAILNARQPQGKNRGKK